MILIRNEQTAIPIDADQLKQDAQIILDALDYSDYDLGILLTTDESMHELNKAYRHKDKPTDILSFPYYPDLQPGERIIPETEDDKNLGDIILAPHYIKQDLPRWDRTFKKHMRALLVHGICHLLGYDHEKDDAYRKMHEKEVYLLSLLD